MIRWLWDLEHDTGIPPIVSFAVLLVIALLGAIALIRYMLRKS